MKNPKYFRGRIILSGCLVLNDNNEILLLYRKDHQHYETPGGKIDLKDCSNPENPTLEELAKAAEREIYEELGNKIRIKKLEYFMAVEFKTPGGRDAIAHKFITKILSGKPIINEPYLFSRIDYLPINSLNFYPISPDLGLLLKHLNKLRR
ncbi:NUDIX hydrolase [Candidatus Woesearchaeota archaeon]|nr:NUDIX hydrolase [Candidatus Woesearchaeota archaeon]